ncbi:hypothetical protein [Haliea sp.]|uniref:hypothetical protein n=1 Tax=Haliea sp. TaxID=1932666 RepID=UPI003527958D
MRWYTALNALLMLLLFNSGVLIHLQRYLQGDLARYLSLSAWWWAVAINALGVSLGLCLSWLAHRASAR